MKDNNLPSVSIVVIGRNEGKNLTKTFEAIQKIDYPKDKIELIYVDSSSTDNSIEIARNYTKNIYPLKSKWPTSGLARNYGLSVAKNEIIHFIDGDIAITSDYLKMAVTKIMKNEAEAVTGYFVEQYPDKFFNFIMSIRRDDIVHRERYTDATNGGGTYLRSKLIEINGYDERILKGQETELGIRFREKGNRILFIDVLQGYHNFDINNLLDFLKFNFYYGKSMGYLLKLKYNLNDYINKEKNIAKKQLFINIISIIIVVSSIFLNYLYIIPLYYFVRILFIFRKYIFLKDNKFNKRQILYTLINYFFNFSRFFGIVYILIRFDIKPKQKMIISRF